jgi:hypothetical protein
LTKKTTWVHYWLLLFQQWQGGGKGRDLHGAQMAMRERNVLDVEGEVKSHTKEFSLRREEQKSSEG